jgi:two-component system nitrate/nitrite response regulator NarL
VTRELATILFDPSPLFREGLSLILNATRFKITKSLSVIGEMDLPPVPSARHLLFLIGCAGDHATSADFVRNLRSQHPSGLIVVLSDRFDQSGVSAALQAGANGYILKTIDRKTLLKSLDLILLDKMVLPSEFQHVVNSSPATQAGPLPTPAAELADDDSSINSTLRKLSPRESVILRHLMLGDANKSIARELGIADATVKVHVKAILRKIRVTNRTQAALWAVEQRKHLSQFASLTDGPARNGGHSDGHGRHVAQ